MKEKTFKFRQSYGRCIKALNDKQAGRLTKIMCNYAFDGILPECKDQTLKSNFATIRRMIDEEKKSIENGRKGGLLSAEYRSQKEYKTEKTHYCPVKKIIKNIMNDKKSLEKNQINENKIVAK